MLGLTIQVAHVIKNNNNNIYLIYYKKKIKG